MASRDRDQQHRQRHHVICGDVRKRSHIPEQDDNGADGEQEPERDCAAALDSAGAR
jgi:hypothetical protein